jgi:peptide/nickel transport system substrate-binding protein
MKQQPEGFYSRWAVGFAGNFWETTNPQTKQPVKAHTIHSDWPWVGNPADPASMDKAKKVRQAMALDIDRDSIAKSIMQGIGRPFYMYELSTDDPYWQDKWKIAYDPDKAKQLMKEAGYENGFTFKFRSDPASLESEVTQALASTWLADLNIKTDISTIVYSTFRPTILDQTAIPWFCGDGVSTFPTLWPKGLTLSSISSGGYNCAMEIPALSKTFMDANTTQDPAKLKEIAYQFYDYLAEERLVVGVAEFPGHAFYNPKRIVEWKMRPEGKGTGFINSPEWIKLAP